MPTEYPLGPAKINGTTISVDLMLNEPTRINRFLQDYIDINRQRFLLDVILSSGGGVSGGSVIYEEQSANALFTDRDVEQVSPGAEFPLVTDSGGAAKVAEPEKWGGKFFITDEARDRNDSRLLERRTKRLGNTIVRKLNQRALEVFNAAIDGMSGAATVVGHDWSTVVLNGTSPTAPQATPLADFSAVQLLADQRELGFGFDTWIVNPIEASALRLLYGASNLSSVLADFGVTTLFVTQQQPQGTALAIASGEVGQYHVEAPLTTESWREYDKQQTWVQSSVRPLMYVDNPYALVEITGL